MTEIPEDVMKAARECYADMLENVIIYDGWDENEFVQHIARAILAERERCAVIADEMGKSAIDASYRMFGNLNNDFHRYENGCKGVAERLRQPKS